MDFHHLLLAGLPAHSAPPPTADIVGVGWQVSSVPGGDIAPVTARRSQNRPACDRDRISISINRFAGPVRQARSPRCATPLHTTSVRAASALEGRGDLPASCPADKRSGAWSGYRRPPALPLSASQAFA